MSEQEQQKWPAMRAYHEASNMAPQRMPAFVETIVKYGNDCLAGKVPAAEKVYPGRPRVKLPASAVGRGLPLQEALRVRRTRRQFSGEPATLAEIAGLLRGACGITGELAGNLPAGASAKLRAWPSAGGLYPVELYLLPLKCKELSASVYHHCVMNDSLVELGAMPAQVELEKIHLHDAGRVIRWESIDEEIQVEDVANQRYVHTPRSTPFEHTAEPVRKFVM